MSILETPPCTLLIDGNLYPIKTDYRVWIRVTELIGCIDTSLRDEKTMEENLRLFFEAETLIFGTPIDVPVSLVTDAILVFLQGYPKNSVICTEPISSPLTDQQAFSLSADINYIIPAIRNQSGIDLSYRRTEPFHFWDFLLEFETLEEHHLISKIIRYRRYNGSDPELLKKKRMFALPLRRTKAQDKEAAEMNAVFYNC